MDDQEVTELIDEVQSTHGMTFWYDSPLLEACKSASDLRLVRPLALRHHGLQNKAAGSCHVLRQTIKAIDGPKFSALWEMFDQDTEAPASSIENFWSEQWAAAYILGEIGGLQALTEFNARSGVDSRKKHFAVVRGILHLVDRYREIAEEGEPMGTMIDVKTGEQTRVPTRDMGEDSYQRILSDRRQANEYFHRPDKDFLSSLKNNLGQIPSDEVELDPDRISGFIDLVFGG